MEPSFHEQKDIEILASRDEPGGWLNIYTLPPLAAALISLIMAALMLKFAFRQVSELELGSLPQTGFENQADSEAAAPQPQAANNAIAALFTPEVQYWGPQIGAWAQEWNLDPNLVATVMQIESCGHPTVVSSAGARGLFQVMPFHFRSGENHTQPDTNALRGLSYLSRSLETHSGNVYLALAGYNGGISMSQRSESNWPAETRRYTYWGSGIYHDAAAGRGYSERLDEWLSSGGASLCRRAAVELSLAE
jgi:soluble lytic murein transglycosylase-like protein